MQTTIDAARTTRRRSRVRRAAVLLVTGAAMAFVVAGLAVPRPASAAPPVPAAPVGLAVSPSAATYPAGQAPVLHVAVTNRSAASCALAATSDLTMSVVSATRDGQPLAPVYALSSPIDGAAATVARRAKPVAANGQLGFDLDLVGADGLTTSVAVPGGPMLSALWPVAAAGHYEFGLTYAMPPSAGAPTAAGGATATTPCLGASDPVTVAFTIGGPASGSNRWWLIAVVAGVVLVVLVVVILLGRAARRRRRRAATGATLAALVLLAGFGAVAIDAVSSTPADAGVVYGVDPDKGPAIFKTYTGCIATIAGFDPGLLTALNPVTVTVYPWTDSHTRQSPSGTAKDSMVAWDPFGGTGFTGETSGATYDPCAGLYHELSHARDRATGVDNGDTKCDDTGVDLDEVRATIAENRYRAAQRPPLKPRTTYDGKKIPTSLAGCTPPKNPPPKKADNSETEPSMCRGVDGPCATHTGDPHLLSFDGYRFDLQAVGEFVAVHSSAGDLDIQVRQAPYPHSRTVAINTAVALRVAGTKLGFYLDQGRVTVHRDGAVATVALGTTDLGGGAKLNHALDPSRGDAFAVTWPDGSVAWVTQVGSWGLTLAVQPRAARTGTLTGLLGPYDGDKANDVSTVDGKVLARPLAFDDLYRTYAPGWRVSPTTSLFDYAPGTGPTDFVDPTFPDRPATVDTLPAATRGAAQAACTLLGLTDPAQLLDCILDVALTGQTLFVVAAASVQAATGGGTAPPGTSTGSTSIGATQTVTVGAGGSTVPFDGTAGQRVYVDVTATTLPDQCGVPEVLNPDGSTLALGCVAKGKGEVDGTVLPTTGRYQVRVRPSDGATGSITFRIVLSTDQVLPITPDGPATTLTVSAPGQIARATFTASVGEKVFVDVLSSTVPPGCGRVSIAYPNGQGINLGCLGDDGKGVVDTTTFAAAGTYAVALDPSEAGTGTATVRLTIVQDQHQSITIGGPAVRADVTEPGAQSELTFTGTAGQKITVEATGAGSQLAGCGTFVLRNAAGVTLDLGCVKDDGTGDMGPTTLPTSGTYLIVVDPPDRRTGSVTLRAHT